MEDLELRYLAQSSHKPCVALSASGKVLSVNDAFVRLLAGQHDEDASRWVVDAYIEDLGISFSSGEDVTVSTLNRLLATTASSEPSIDSSGLRDTATETSKCSETDKFWNEEEGLSLARDAEVKITRKNHMSDSGIYQSTASTPQSEIFARLFLHATSIQTQRILILKFSRSDDSGIFQPSPYLARAKEELLSGPDFPDEIIDGLIPHCTAIIDNDGMVLYLTSSWYHFTGSTEAESLGGGWASHIHPGDRDAMVVSWGDALQNSRDSWTYEARLRMRNGDYRWFLVRGLSWKDESGQVQRWYASMVDINRPILERMETERRNRSILDLLSKADVSLWAVDQSYRMYMREGNLSWDPNVTGHLPKSPSDGDKVEGDNITETINDLLVGKTSIKNLDHKVNGRWYRTRFVSELAPESQGEEGTEVQAVLGLTIDVTDARAMLEVENKKLLANERDAREASRLKSQFLANMSHEIRTPIAGIIGLAEIISEGDLSSTQREMASGILQTARFLLTLINDVLDFSKIEAGHMDIESVPFRPHDIINDISLLMNRQAQEKGLDLVFRSTVPKETCVIGDPIRIRQILTNLLSNSVKFTDRGSVTLTLDSFSSANTDHDINLRFVVKDTGCGIPGKVLSKLFQPFSQADASTSRTYGGTGLGLSICWRLATIMGGTVLLDSDPSSGTIATVQLPYRLHAQPIPPDSISNVCLSDGHAITASNCPGLSSGAPSKKPARLQEQLGATNHTGERSQTHILVVEDNAVNQTIALSNIRKLGFSASAVWNGNEALDFLDASLSKEKPVPDVVFMDCMMPVMDGYDATRTIRQSAARFGERLQNIPIIAMTASAIKGDRGKCYSAGMDDYVSKPVNRKVLESLIVKWTSDRNPSG